MRGCSSHSLQEAQEPDRRLRHPSHEEDHQGTGERHLHQAAGGGARTSRQLRASHLSSRSHRRGRRHHRRYVEGARIPRSSQHAEGRGQQILRSQSGVINGVIDQILRLVAFLF